MITNVYVKSHLMPGRHKSTKRRTEEVKVDKGEAEEGYKTSSGSGGSTVFKPSTFKFLKPLEYGDLDDKAVESKSIEFEVCIVQKYTRKSFVVASFGISLKSAVRKLIRENFRLLMKTSTKIPENMKVYSAQNLTTVYNSRNYYSNPNLRLSPSGSMKVPESNRALSDTDLIRVTSEDVSQSCVSLHIPEQDDYIAALKDVTIAETPGEDDDQDFTLDIFEDNPATTVHQLAGVHVNKHNQRGLHSRYREHTVDLPITGLSPEAESTTEDLQCVIDSQGIDKKENIVMVDIHKQP